MASTAPAGVAPAQTAPTAASQRVGPFGGDDEKDAGNVAAQPAATRTDPSQAATTPPAPIGPGQQVELRSTTSQALLPTLAAQLEEHAGRLREAEVAIEQVRRRFKEINKEAAPDFTALAKANESKRIMSIGMVRQAALYNTHLQLPHARVSMGTEVQATAENQGTKQVMRGSMWTGPQTADRREMFLQVNWRDGYEVVHWERNEDSITGASVRPAQVHQMAAAINRAARHHPAAARERAQHREEATLAIARVTAPLRADVRALLAQLEQHGQTSTAVWVFSEGVKDYDPADRRERRAIKDLASRTHKTERSALEGLTQGRTLLAHLSPRWPGASELPAAQYAQLASATRPALGPAAATAGQRAALLRALGHAMRQVLDQRRDQPAPLTTPPAGSETAAHPARSIPLVDLLSQLAQLRDAGVLTEQEFATKKADILSRL